MVLILLLFSFYSFAATQDNLYLGEKNFTHYYDINSPEVLSRGVGNRGIFSDEVKKESFLESFIAPDLFRENRSFIKEMYDSATCSNADLAKYFDYYRYAHRLIVMSYLYEAIISYDLTQARLGRTETCKKTFNRKVSQCSPKSGDMKVFINNVKHYLSYDKRSLLKSSFSVKNFRNKFNDSFVKNKFDLLHYRLNSKPRNIPAKIKEVCSAESQLFLDLCNEKDSLFGLNESLESYDLLARSSAFNYLKGDINASACLKKFKQMFAYKELSYPTLKSIIPFLYQRLERTNLREGRVFALGALKEFVNVGLSLYEPKLKKSAPKLAKAKVAKKKLVTRTLRKQEIKKIVNLVPKSIVVKKVVKKKQSKMSAFLKATRFLKSRALSKVPVDMNEFKYDYILSLPLRDKLDVALKPFVSLSALRYMKKKDKLGSIKGPIPLLFVKYMIDHKQHRYLYNIINTLSDKFYVINDIDKKLSTREVPIRLVNDFKTGYKWQIFVLDKI